jgi:hypothetical protein
VRHSAVIAALLFHPKDVNVAGFCIHRLTTA